MRSWLQTSFVSVQPTVVEAQDYWGLVPSTDLYEVQQPLGTPTVMITPPPPVVGGVTAMPPFFPELWRSRGREAQKHLSYRIPPPDTVGKFLSTDMLVVGKTQELQPIYNARRLREKQMYVATVQEQTNRLRISQIPSGQYGDFKCRILNEVQRHFLEPVIDDGQTWQLWTSTEVHEALTLRIYRFLMETGMLREESSETSPNAAVIPQTALDVRRVEWKNGSVSRGLQRMDPKVADLGFPGWDSTSSSQPVGYIEEPSPEDSMLLKVCPPAGTGSVTMRYVPAPKLTNGVCEAFPIPRMFSWAIKWGLIADLLKKEGEANDPVRAEAASKAYDMGVKLARLLLGTKL